MIRRYEIPMSECCQITMESSILSGEIIPGNNDPEPYVIDDDSDNWN